MEFSVKTKLKDIGVVVQNITESIAKNLYIQVANLARLTYNKAIEIASSKLHGTRQDYINALQLEEEAPGVFVVYLNPTANHLEEGYPRFPMLPRLAQGPKSKVAKDGHRYTIIPLKQTTSADVGQKSLEMVQDLRHVIKSRKFKTVRQGVNPKSGKYTTVERLLDDPDIPKHLRGLTRVREYSSKDAKRPLSSAYLTFRVASEKQDAAKHWVHPGFRGVHIFPELEKWVDVELDKIIADIFAENIK